MTAMTRVISRAFPAMSPQLEILKQLALFCGAGLTVWLLMATYGLDLSSGFF
jgi:ribose/xylose/arabinose/galactoside ABC-type transport system permease subunit